MVYRKRRTVRRPLYRKKKRTTFRRKRRIGARNIPRTGTMVNPSRNPFPPRYIVKLRYGQEGWETPTGTTLGVQQFRANSPFDPDFTGTGHQAYGLDQISLLYRYCRVMGMAYRVTLSTDGNAHFVVGVRTDSDSSTIASYYQMIEDKQTKWSIVGPENSGRHSMVTFKGYCNNPKVFAKTKNQYRTDDDFSGETDPAGGTSYVLPAAQSYLNIVGYSQGGLTTTVRLYWTVELTYYCIFSNLRDFSSS